MDRILGLDYGTRRLGFAVSDPTGIIATPLETVDVRSDDEACRAVADRVAETGARSMVVGNPLNMDGTPSAIALRVAAFLERLREFVDIPMVLWDERLSSREAERVLLEADVSRAKRRQVRDKLAAQLILQNYLDAQSDMNDLHHDDE